MRFFICNSAALQHSGYTQAVTRLLENFGIFGSNFAQIDMWLLRGRLWHSEVEMGLYCQVRLDVGILCRCEEVSYVRTRSLTVQALAFGGITHPRHVTSSNSPSERYYRHF